MSEITKNIKDSTIIIGLGATGLSCARFLTQLDQPFIVLDSRDNPPMLAQFQQEFPQVSVHTGANWPVQLLDNTRQILASPGIPLSTPYLVLAKEMGIEIIGDVELFARYNKAPVVAITGANGKSTVTTLVGDMAKASGKKVAVIGNIGEPVLNVLLKGAAEYDFAVMELSSFQLETTNHLETVAATVLNITPDHMDRYADVPEYAKAKHRIYYHAKHAIINKDDPLSESHDIPKDCQRIYFTLGVPGDNEFGLRRQAGKTWLAFGSENWISADELKIMGEHNLANALAAFALGYAAGFDKTAMCEALRQFRGLAHRCQWVGEKDGIQWINDSKGTNIGATLAAIKGIGAQLEGQIVLMLGGDGKGADFSELAPLVAQHCRAIIVMGKDADKIMAALQEKVTTYPVANLQQAVERAANCAKAGDVVLLSPACSSLDQFKDFAQRGQIFMDTVKDQLAR